MNEPSSEQMAGKLFLSAVDRKGPTAGALSDPIADTPMVLTLDQLDAYDHDPRLTRNPRHDEIKSSIFQRNLDAAPPVTRRPGADRYIIRNGGNTRLKILRELWSETKDRRFFEIRCLFRPWSARGEIVLLTGHLAENELRGNLTFIERALAVAKAGEMYEAEIGSSSVLSQSELARRLTADGYPISQSQISRMEDTVRYLLPAIPKILFAGLGRPQIERLALLRKQATRVWDKRCPATKAEQDFGVVFQEVLATFDTHPDAFTVQRAQDELLGQMADLLSIDYDTLALELADADLRKVVLDQDPPSVLTEPPAPKAPHIQASVPGPKPSTSPATPERLFQPTRPTTPTGSPAASFSKSPSRPISATSQERPEDSAASQRDDERVARNIVSPVQVTDRLRDIQQTIAAATGDTLTDFRTNVLKAIPVQAGGLHPISDIWYIETNLDSLAELRQHIAQLAQEIAAESGAADSIDFTQEGIGFSVREAPNSLSSEHIQARAASALLFAITAPYLTRANRRGSSGPPRLSDDLGPLLVGPYRPCDSATVCRLSDAALVKLFRLIRLARRIVELQSSRSDPAK